MTIQAIETKYKGYRFRSRLEARWAVAFDHRGIKWEYEAQGYKARHPISDPQSDHTFYYLPDFWLPEHQMFVEVKGSLTEAEFIKVIDAAAYLSAPEGGCGGGNDMIVVGPIPEPRSGVSPSRLHMHKGYLGYYQWDGIDTNSNHIGNYFNIAADGTDEWMPGIDTGDAPTTWERAAKELLHPAELYEYASRDGLWDSAYRAARSARFEHDERK